MNENIGINAGKIWQYLEQNGESKIVRVKRELKLSSCELYLALGWLAREGKVNISVNAEDAKELNIVLA